MRRACPILLIAATLLVACNEKPPQVKRDDALKAAIKSINEDKPEAALASIDQAIEIDPDAAHLHQIKGSVLFLLDRYSQAVDQYEQAFRLNGKSAEACVGAALSLKMLGKDGEAASWLTRAENLLIDRVDNPPDPQRYSKQYIQNAQIDARLHLALIAALRGEDAAALAQINLIAETYPNWSDAEAWRNIVRNHAFEKMIKGQL